jgi:holo-ACP synthase/triphosphoribosyl-dephospho-CoA synthase
MQPEKKDGNNRATMEEILDARERRACYQQGLLDEFHSTLICYALNIAGSCKLFPLAEQTFFEGKRLINRELERNKIVVAAYRETQDKAGYASYYVVTVEAEQLKRLMLSIEESGSLGRLFDIDVLRPDGTKVSRRELGFSERTCLICGKPAMLCSRSATHLKTEVIRKTKEIMQDYFEGQYADRIAQVAVRAALYEVAITPKPGLVDRQENGAHQDMDIFTFIDSVSALAPWFRAFVLKGLTFHGLPRQLFETCRHLGVLAEDAMLYATNGINTHKGLIFSCGIFCAAMGYLHGNGKSEDLETLLSVCSEMALEAHDALEKVTSQVQQTHGERIYAKYGLSGVRGEAANGFPNVKNFALPLLCSLKEQGLSYNDAGAIVLLHLISRVDDTNIVSRSDLETLRSVQKDVRECLDQISDLQKLLEFACQLDRKFVLLNISPGGCADLLAITFFLWFLFP